MSIDASVQTGVNCTVWQFATLCQDVLLGESVVVGSAAWIGRGCQIGSFTRIQHGVFLPNHTRVGERVFIGPNVTLCDDKYPMVRLSYEPTYHADPPILEDDCSIGAGAIILPGVRIGRGAMVGAGSVVSRDVPPKATFIGIPARLLTHN